MSLGFKQVYLNAGDQFIGRPVLLTVGEPGDSSLVTAEFEYAAGQHGHRDHQFGGVMVGTHIEKRDREIGDFYSPLFLEEETGRFYYIRNVREERTK